MNNKEMLTSFEALEELYRKDCCVKSPNPNCGNCELGKKSKCKLYSYYILIKQDLDKLEKLEKVIQILNNKEVFIPLLIRSENVDDYNSMAELDDPFSLLNIFQFILLKEYFK